MWQALAKLAELPGGSGGTAPKEALAEEPDAVAALVAVLLGRQPPRQQQGAPGSATRPLAGDLALHNSLLLRR
jgi:hypothetical protein